MADEKIIFSMNGVGKVLPHNNKVILKDIYLSFFYGAKIGIIGLNGSGKSTLLKIIAGVEKSYKGEVVWAPGYSVGYLEQEPQMDPSKTVLEVVQEGVQEVMDLLAEYNEISAAFMEPMDDDRMNALIERQGELTEQIEHVGGWEIDSKLERAMDALQCPPPDASVATLSGGERRRVALCRLLLRQPDVLLLDEPTNHLDTESIQWLEAHLQQYKGTVIAVTHDRYFLDNVAGWILELDRGEGIPWKGNYSSWLDQKTKRLAMEEKQESKRRKTLERELEWVRMAPKARQAKQKARLGAYEKMASADVKEKEANLEIYIPNGPHLGNKVIEFHDVSKAYGDKLLFEHLSFVLPPAGIVGVIGNWPMWTSSIVPSIRIKPCTRPLRAIPSGCGWGTGTSMRVPGCRALISAGPTRKRNAASCPAANGTGCTWRSRSRTRGMCSCWMNRPTMWMSTRYVPWRRAWTASRAAPWW